jgi:hypothetical protein
MNFRLKCLPILGFITFICSLNAQTELSRKGNWYMYWGWNQAKYTQSNIRFHGDNYDFTLQNVVATDRQTPFDVKVYFKLNTITIPQVNYKIGYFLTDKYDVSFGVDHMKYVMRQNQTVKINGSIQKSGSPYDGKYVGENIVLTEDFLTFEHTDGLNYLNFEVNRYDKLLDLTKIKLNKIGINLTEGISVGALMPRTNTKLLKNNRYDQYHFAGYGVGAKLGIQVTLGAHFFLQSDMKSGFINMPDIRTTQFTTDRAKQHFFFWQGNILFGFQVKFRK